MKTNSLAKFSLTIIAAMVLAACGSSGGSDSPSTNSTASTTAAQAAAKKAADEAAAAKKAADEAAAAKKAADEAAAAKKAADEAAAAKKAADEAAAKKAADEAAAKKAAAALAAENSDRKADNAVLRPTPTGSDLLEKSSVGAKNVVKNKSNLTTNYSSDTDSTSNTPELMNVQSPDKDLRTLVVGKAPDKTGTVQVTYLAGLENLKAAPEGGKLTFEAAVKAKKDDKAKDDKAKDDKAKDNKAKDDKATVSVYTVEKGRKNYTENYGGKIADPEKKTVADPADTDKLREPDHTSIVGQMYGAKITDVKEDGKETNAPFTQKPYKNVQYGSLTSALHAQDISTLGDGDEKDTKIAKYGYTGTPGTEDNYFYRLNENNMDVAGLKKLKNDNPNTVLKYDGHAVTYGIDNSWTGEAKAKTNSVPTAIVAAEKAPESGLISGTHVTAKINLNTNAVEGNLYNKWYDGALKGDKDVRLVDFTGSMSENGNIAGTSHNNIDNTGGLFGASLNKEATEMGGVVSSNDHTAGGKWGAVFGAQLTGRETVPSVKPATPADPVKPADEPSINSSGNVTR